MAKSPDGDKREKKYEERGDIYTLQEYRANKASDDAYRDPTHEFLRTERRLREIAQREVSLSAEIKEVPVSSDRSQKIEKELLDLREEYFMTDQKRGRFLDNCPSEMLIRGLNLWRSHPQWYLHKTLLKDCADKGGCCGRDCGCCQGRKLGPARQFGAGHCTTECWCCQKARGFALTDKAKQAMKNLYPLNPISNRSYYRKIMLVSIYGLADGYTENPFDLIDGPPDYEQSGSSKEWTKDSASILSKRRIPKMLRIFEK